MNHRWKRNILMIAVSFLLCTMAGSVYAASAGQISVTVTQDYGKAKEVLRLVNKARSSRGRSALKMDSTLTKNAVTRAAELCVYVPEGVHYRPNGKEKTSSNSSILYEDCLEYIGGSFSAGAAVKTWMESPPHKRGILLSSAKSVGVACVTLETPDGISEHYVLEFSGKNASGRIGSGTKKITVKIRALSKYLNAKYFSIIEKYTEEGSQLRVAYRSPAAKGDYLLSPASFTWTSSNKKLVPVSSTGVLTGEESGRATITAVQKKSPKIRLRYIVDI